MQVAVKMLATQTADAAAVQQFEQEIKDTIHAARTCSLVCRVLGYCFKEQKLCLVMLRYAGSLIGLVPITIRNCVSSSHKLYSTTDIAGHLELTPVC